MAERSGSWYLQRHNRWIGDRGNWDNLMEEVSEFMVPGKRGFTLQFTPGEERLERVHDSTVFDCISRFTDAIHFAVANPFTEWFGLRFREDELNETHEASAWLEDCQERMQSAFEESNWTEQLNESIGDWGTFGTTVMSELENPVPADGDPTQFQGLCFRSHHLSNVTFGDGHDGRVRTVNLEWKMTAEEAYKRFANSVDPEESEKAEQILGKSLMRTLKDSPDEEVKFLQCIHERDREVVKEGLTAPKFRAFTDTWVHMSGERAKKVKEGGFYELPVFVARFRERSEDKNGIGLGEMSLPDVRTLNEAERLDLGAWEQDIDPPIVQQGEQIIGDVNFIARGITTVRDLNKIRAWTDIVRRSYTPNQIRAEEKREQIRAIWKYHQLDLPPRERVGEMTATEVVKRMERIYQLMGPPLARLITELISPVIERAFAMMMRREAFLPVPQVVLKSGASYDIEYTGPLARAQRLEEVQTLDRFMSEVYAASEADPEVLDLVDRDALWRRKAKRMGVPTDVLRDENTVTDIRKKREARRAQQQQIEQNAAAARGLRDVSAAVGEEGTRAAIQEGFAAAA